MNEKVRKLVTMAMLAALSIVLVYVIHFPIFPAASFLEYDSAWGSSASVCRISPSSSAPLPMVLWRGFC